jgi:hypothetical protein
LIRSLWPTYIRCKAGGDGTGPTGGTIQPFDFLMGTKTGTTQITGVFDWVKCNLDFKAYYMSNYDSSQFESFEAVLAAAPNVNPFKTRRLLLSCYYIFACLKVDN